VCVCVCVSLCLRMMEPRLFRKDHAFWLRIANERVPLQDGRMATRQEKWLALVARYEASKALHVHSFD
jgi:hypothetical protein